MIKKAIWKNLTIMVLGGAALSTWMVGACDAVDGNQDINTRRSAIEAARDSLDAVTTAPADYVITPGGIVVHKDCVHQVPDGATVNADLSVTLKGKKIAQHAACTHKRYRFAGSADATPPGTGNGWVETSWGNATSTTFTHMEVGYWVVPANPVNRGQLIYLFPSLTNGNSILQPVLQWGNNGYFGGPSWVYANWWVMTASTYFVSSVTNASVGDQMWGSMDMTFQSAPNQYWQVVVKDITKGLTTTSNFTVPETNAFSSAQVGALEAYRVSTCDSFPSGSSGQTYFPAPLLYQGLAYWDRNLFNPSWFTLDAAANNWTGPNCGFGVSVGSTGNTWLNY
jgi:hypothetical protein